MDKNVLLLYFIMGSNNTSNHPVDVLTKAIDGGVTCFQFREKGTGAYEGADKEKLARDLQSVCRANGVPFIINDDVELAIRIKADGIHVGQDDEPVSNIKRKLPSAMKIGVSAKTVEEARDAKQQGADYIGVGPMFATSTKEDAKVPIGPEAIDFMRQNGVNLPIVGIGGINESNAQEVMKAGADGVSLISAISRADDPAQAARSLREQLTRS